MRKHYQGVVILSVKSDGKDRPGIPNADTILQVGDVVTVYGEEHHIRKIFDSVPYAPNVVQDSVIEARDLKD